MVPFLLYAKRLKEVTRLLLISPRWVNCRDLYLTIDGLRGAVLQMIAHGFVVVGLFFISDIIFRRYETRTIAESGIRTQSPRFASMFLLLVLASVALPTTFNFVGEFTVLYSLSQINGLPLGNDYHLGRLLHVENVPASNARETNTKRLRT
jgi:NADH:ubiquinone oxidoreductase subunit 5 (subunit L)/multisubunit Na+/H+ antiporter MnhA subunit